MSVQPRIPQSVDLPAEDWEGLDRVARSLNVKSWRSILRLIARGMVSVKHTGDAPKPRVVRQELKAHRESLSGGYLISDLAKLRENVKPLTKGKK